MEEVDRRKLSGRNTPVKHLLLLRRRKFLNMYVMDICENTDASRYMWRDINLWLVTEVIMRSWFSKVL